MQVFKSYYYVETHTCPKTQSAPLSVFLLQRTFPKTQGALLGLPACLSSEERDTGRKMLTVGSMDLTQLSSGSLYTGGLDQC